MTEGQNNSVLAAFEMLIEEIEVEIECVNQDGARAFDEGDYRSAKDLIERAEQISSFREKITSFRSEWESLSASEKDDKGSRKNNEKTTIRSTSPWNENSRKIISAANTQGTSGFRWISANVTGDGESPAVHE